MPFGNDDKKENIITNYIIIISHKFDQLKGPIESNIWLRLMHLVLGPIYKYLFGILSSNEFNMAEY